MIPCPSPNPQIRCLRNYAKGSIIDIDAQDAQDNQDGTLLHEQPAPAMIVSGLSE